MTVVSKTIGRLACALAVLLLAGALVSGAMADTTAPRVSGAWVRLPAAPGRPAAGYFTLKGGATADRLVGVTSPRAGRVEMHSSMTMGGMMHMEKLTDVALPAGGTVPFAPAGNHLMLFDVKGAGARFPLTLRFASGATISVEAAARTAGEGAP